MSLKSLEKVEILSTLYIHPVTIKHSIKIIYLVFRMLFLLFALSMHIHGMVTESLCSQNHFLGHISEKSNCALNPFCRTIPTYNA